MPRGGLALQALLFGLTGFWLGSILAVEQMALAACRLSAQRGHYSKSKLFQHYVEAVCQVVEIEPSVWSAAHDTRDWLDARHVDVTL